MTNPSRRPDAAPPTETAAVRAREALARKWSYLLSSVIVVALSRDELDAELGAQLDALCVALHNEPFDPAPFEEVGERLVALGYVNEPGLRRTVDVLGKGLLALEEFRGIEQHTVRVVGGIGRGRALINVNGRTIVGTWRKSSITKPTRFYDRAGNQVTLTRGQTFVQVVPRGTKVRIVRGKDVPPPDPSASPSASAGPSAGSSATPAPPAP